MTVFPFSKLNLLMSCHSLSQDRRNISITISRSVSFNSEEPFVVNYRFNKFQVPPPFQYSVMFLTLLLGFWVQGETYATENLGICSFLFTYHGYSMWLLLKSWLVSSACIGTSSLSGFHHHPFAVPLLSTVHPSVSA